MSNYCKFNYGYSCPEYKKTTKCPLPFKEDRCVFLGINFNIKDEDDGSIKITCWSECKIPSAKKKHLSIKEASNCLKGAFCSVKGR